VILPRREFLLAGAAAILLRPARPTAKSCIRIHLTGGVSHLDTFDPKPDAPSEIRSPFRPIRTSAPDIQISELFPRIARQAHQLTLIRSVYTTDEPKHPVFPPQPDFLIACRNAVHAVETGARTIHISMFESAHGLTWDMHGWKPFSTMAAYRDTVAPTFDLGFSTLLENLAQRGLLETTLVAVTTEFGRTPRINPDGGRDHWPHCFTAILAGAGIEGGQIHGSSDSIGAEPRDNPITLAGLEASLT
jgi:hypothetical protein